MALTLRFSSTNLQKLRPLLSARHVSTSKKHQDTATEVVKESKFTAIAPKKNWVSYGFDRKNEQEDRISLHLTFFGSVTLALVGTTFLIMYGPDTNLKDWAQREAFIELRRREEAGLPLIDRNLIDPENVILPSDEELGDTDIII